MSTPAQPPGSGMFSDFDRFAMQRALTLAARGLETTDPNPRVGCVVAQRGRVIGEGWHERAGEAHAEIAALRAAGNQAAGATVYVTLEPCSHHGRTPPCVEALIAARVARVLIAARDPTRRSMARVPLRCVPPASRSNPGSWKRRLLTSMRASSAACSPA